MPEQQNIEYKEGWHDDYLKWISGFANANGGTIFIGKDDDGKTVGVADYKKLLDDLPNKIRDVLGIMAEVNLHEENGLYYLAHHHAALFRPNFSARQLLLSKRCDQTGIKRQRAQRISAPQIRQNLG